MLRVARISFAVTALFTSTLLINREAVALRSKAVSLADFSEVDLTVTVNHKDTTRSIACLKTTAGTVVRSRRKILFTKLDDRLLDANRRLRAARSKRSRTKIKNEIAVYKALRSAARKACVQTAAVVSVKEYKGPFGLKQAQRLVEVFALGGRPGMAENYVRIGLNAAVQDLLTIKPDTEVDNFRAKLTCGPNPFNTTNPDTCYEQGNINDFYMDGYLSGLEWRSVNSNNPAQMALFEWAMDQRAPGNPRVLDDCAKWLFPRYINMVDEFAFGGDYKAFAAKWVKNPFIHGKWLSGATNHSGVLKTGNEDFGREFLELFTTGLYKPDGSPVYNDFDVYQSSLAMSGLSETVVKDQNDNDICGIGFVDDFHRSGPKVLFADSGHPMTVDTADDMAAKIFVAQGDQVAYELARRLWGRFVNSKGTPQAYLALAKIIKDNDFKLWPVMAKLMKSEAFYAVDSNKTILKNPHTWFISFVRMSGIPAGDYSSLSDRLNRVGMHLGRPPTVFGFTYRNNQLASDAYQLERNNALINHALNQNWSTMKTRYGWTVHNRLVQGVPLTGHPGIDMTNEVLKRLNMTESVTQAQKDLMIQFLDYYLGNCDNNQGTDCFMLNNVSKKLYHDGLDLDDVNDSFDRLRMLYAMVANMPAFATM